jgi:dipeptidyl aminopeptidase/acylaminoacyl peptidase
MSAPPPFGLDEVDRLRHLAGASVTPDGARVAAAVTWRDAGRDRSVVRIVDVATSALVAELVAGDEDGAPAWSPGGDALAFVSDRDGEPQLFACDRDGGALRRLTDEPRGLIGVPLWSPDGAAIALATPAGPLADPEQPRRVARAMWRLDGVGVIDDHVTQILCVDVATGAARRFTDGDGIAGPLAWSPDGRALLLAVSCLPSAAAGDTAEDLCELRIADGGVRRLAAHRADGFRAAYLPDGSITYTFQRDADANFAPGRLWTLAPDGTRTCRTEGQPFDVGGDVIVDVPGAFLMLPDALWLHGDDAIVRTQRGGALAIHRIAAAGPAACAPVVADPHRCFHPLDVSGPWLAAATTSIDEPCSLLVCDLRGDDEPRPVTVHAAAEHVPFRRPRVERDAGPCDTWLLHPTDGSPPPYATVLLVHGGPHSAFGEAFFPTAQLLAGAGFAVLLANPSGSRGYGEAYARKLHRDWGGVDAGELLAALDALVERGLADPARLGVTGLSYGGFMTCMLAARETRFAAAVAENPVVDLFSEERTSDIGPDFVPVYFGTDEPAATAARRRCSPSTWAAGCRTPTLLILGLEDARCPPSQGLQFHAALRANGCASEVLLLPGAAHAGGVTGPVAGRRAQEAALLDWFARHLRR